MKKKHITTLLLILAVSLVTGACGARIPLSTKADASTSVTEKTDAATTAPATTAPSVSVTEATVAATTTAAATTTTAPSAASPATTVTAPPAGDNNYFYNDTNNAYDTDCVSVKPMEVWYQDGKLYANCFVINGFDRTVYDINVKHLEFSNDDGLIASADSFGVLADVTLSPYTYIVWTFVFDASSVSNSNADLSSLTCKASTSNSY